MDTGIFKLLLFGIVTICLLYFSRRHCASFVLMDLSVFRLGGNHRTYSCEHWLVVFTSVFISPNHFLDFFNLVFSVPGKWSVYDSVHGETQHSAAKKCTLLTFEKTSVLVTSGDVQIYPKSSHSSLLFLAWGTFLKDVSWSSVCLVAALTICLVFTARADELANVFTTSVYPIQITCRTQKCFFHFYFRC